MFEFTTTEPDFVAHNVRLTVMNTDKQSYEEEFSAVFPWASPSIEDCKETQGDVNDLE